MTLTNEQILTLAYHIAGRITADKELSSHQKVALRLDIEETITEWNDHIASVPTAECLPHGGKCTACLSCQRLDGYDEACEQRSYGDPHLDPDEC